MSKTPLRDWAAPSYDIITGRTASSLQEMGTGAKGNHTTNVSAQKDAPSTPGQKGAPGVDGMNRSGSGDSGRNRLGASKVP